MLVDLLESKKCFKLICGAGNEDVASITKLVEIYARAGVRYFDLSANLEVVKAVKQTLREVGVEGYTAVSYGIKGDPHVAKAVINSHCTDCGKCIAACPYDAIVTDEYKVCIAVDKCIGCGKCPSACEYSALYMDTVPKQIKETLPALVAEGIDSVELHVAGKGDLEAYTKLENIRQFFNGPVSICIDRSNHSDKALVEKLTRMTATPYPYMVQADGMPMSGNDDAPSTTLQALACAQIVERANLPAHLLLSGGTNIHTSRLAKEFGLQYHGISYGSAARKIVKPYMDDMWLAVEKAKEFVDYTLQFMGDK